MIYRSNLEAPDIAAGFAMLSTPRPWSFGHDVPSDPEFEPECGFFTHDEAAILFNVAKQVRGVWVDIGSRFGWTTAHLAAAGCKAWAVDSSYGRVDYFGRLQENISSWNSAIAPWAGTSAEFIGRPTSQRYDGFVIDGNHDAPEPLNDARGCLDIAKPGCVMVFHDFRGQPIRDAVAYLAGQGFQTKAYSTPNGVAVAWRGLDSFTAPEHVADPGVSAV